MGSKRVGVGLVLGWMLGLAVGCTGSLTGGGAGTGDRGGDGTIEILAPAPGTEALRDGVGQLGYLVADVAVELETSDGISEVGYAVAGGDEQARFAVGEPFFAELRQDGEVTLEITGYDDSGDSIAYATVDLVVMPPSPADCHGWLDLYGHAYDVSGATDGVDDPVLASSPINGVAYRYAEQEQPRTELFADCSLVLALLRSAPILRERGVTEVMDLGTYNYRCIGGGTPPNCPSGISQHAYGNAIDIAGYTTADGAYYSVLDDWAIDSDDEETCDAATEGEKDAFLHEIICAQKAAGVWNIALTPNYNADHRNHFHVDLAEGEDLIERVPPPRGIGVDVDVSFDDRAEASAAPHAH